MTTVTIEMGLRSNHVSNIIVLLQLATETD